MKIAIIGTRGIPNAYGGFEQCAEYLSAYLVNKGHDVTVYNSHNHPYSLNEWKNVKLIHKFDPEKQIGTAGQFIYDLNCILDCRKRNYDIILQLGYTSNSIWHRLLPSKPVVITNMDGQEWKRSKYSKPIQKFLRYAEKLAVISSDYLVSDSPGIQTYIKQKYGKDSTFIPYGAEIFNDPSKQVLAKYNLTPLSYDLMICRMEPENNVETILDGHVMASRKRDIVVIGDINTRYGKKIKNKFQNYKTIHFFGPIYKMIELNNLRHFSNLYFHGHSVGGTNPSLLEAMASGCLVCANDNIFNQSILGEQAYYFSNSKAVSELINNYSKDPSENEKLDANYEKIKNVFSWDAITDSYEQLFKESLK
jgi:glycosyltransferase involved in cell wall biosynthesis